MVTPETLKEKFMAHLDTLDFSKMPMYDLNVYVDILDKLYKIEPNHSSDLLTKIACGFGNINPAPTKETSTTKKAKGE